MVDVNSAAFKAVNSKLSAMMVVNLLRHTSLDDETRKAIPTQMESLTLQIIEAYEAAKPSGREPAVEKDIEMDRMRSALTWVSNAYERIDISHKNFRVRAKMRADAVLFSGPAMTQGQSPPIDTPTPDDSLTT